MPSTLEPPEIEGHQLVFVGGLHRSGTTFFARMLAGHPDTSGLTNTGSFEDEGQHIQDIFPAANRHGGPGNFAFAPAMHLIDLDAGGPEDRAAKARRLLGCWTPHWDMSRRVLIEKSPPNIIKARYLQALFPSAQFIMVTRHPIAVSGATARWSKTSRYSLTAHWVKAHEIMQRDLPQLDRVMTVRYEDIVAAPQDEYSATLKWLDLAEDTTSEPVQSWVNEKYFEQWEKGGPILRRSARRATETFGPRIAKFGYSMEAPYAEAPTSRPAGAGAPTSRPAGAGAPSGRPAGAGAPDSPAGRV